MVTASQLLGFLLAAMPVPCNCARTARPAASR